MYIKAALIRCVYVEREGESEEWFPSAIITPRLTSRLSLSNLLGVLLPFFLLQPICLSSLHPASLYLAAISTSSLSPSCVCSRTSSSIHPFIHPRLFLLRLPSSPPPSQSAVTFPLLLFLLLLPLLIFSFFPFTECFPLPVRLCAFHSFCCDSHQLSPVYFLSIHHQMTHSCYFCASATACVLCKACTVCVCFLCTSAWVSKWVSSTPVPDMLCIEHAVSCHTHTIWVLWAGKQPHRSHALSVTLCHYFFFSFCLWVYTFKHTVFTSPHMSHCSICAAWAWEWHHLFDPFPNDGHLKGHSEGTSQSLNRGGSPRRAAQLPHKALYSSPFSLTVSEVHTYRENWWSNVWLLGCCHALPVLACALTLRKKCGLLWGCSEGVTKLSVGGSVHQLGSHFPSFYLSSPLFFFKTPLFILLFLSPQIFMRRLQSLLVPRRPNPNVLLQPWPLSGNAKPRQFPWRQAARAAGKPPTTPPTPLLLLLLRRCCRR